MLVPLPSDRLMFTDALGLARGGSLGWTRHRYVRTVQGHKEVRTIEVAAVGEMTSWDSFVEAARGYGVADASLWVALVREVEPNGGAAGGLLGAGEHAAVRRRLRGLPGVPSAMAYRERRLPGAEGGLRAGGAAVGTRRRGGPLPHDADDPGIQHGAGLPESGRPTTGEAGDPPPASRGAAGAGTNAPWWCSWTTATPCCRSRNCSAWWAFRRRQGLLPAIERPNQPRAPN